jgi:hypothetical protein
LFSLVSPIGFWFWRGEHNTVIGQLLKLEPRDRYSEATTGRKAGLLWLTPHKPIRHHRDQTAQAPGLDALAAQGDPEIELACPDFDHRAYFGIDA